VTNTTQSREAISAFFERIAAASLPAGSLISLEIETEYVAGDLRTIERIRIEADGRPRVGP
jgi:hypothetical protein